MKDSFRNIWFLTRPTRDPADHKDALQALSEVTNRFTNNQWSGNRTLQKKYEEALYKNDLKRKNVSVSGSGGRTWVAMLRTYDYVYLDDAGKLHLTKVGQALLKDKKQKANITKQLLTLQIPNDYFLDKGFRPKFAPSFRIQPIRFLIKVASSEELNYHVTKEEVIFFVIEAHKNSELNQVITSILEYRNMSPKQKEEKKASISKKYEHRTRIDHSARTFAENNADVAHTFMYQADYTGLVTYLKNQADLRFNTSDGENVEELLKKYDARYPFSNRYLISLENFAVHAGLDIDSYKASTLTTNKVATSAHKMEKRFKSIISKYPSFKSFSREYESNILKNEGIRNRDIDNLLDRFDNYDTQIIDEQFIEDYLNEPDNLKFEERTQQVFDLMGFTTERHPNPNSQFNNANENIDTIAYLDTANLFLIDSKNYQTGKFIVTASLRNTMGISYIPAYNNYAGRKARYFIYVAAKKIGGTKNLEKITELVKKNNGIISTGAVITANTLLELLDYELSNKITVAKRKEYLESLCSNEGYDNFSKIKRKLNIK